MQPIPNRKAPIIALLFTKARNTKLPKGRDAFQKYHGDAYADTPEQKHIKQSACGSIVQEDDAPELFLTGKTAASR